MQFSGLIPGLQSGALDAAISAITITRQRMQQVNFSHAYYHSGLSLLVPKNSNIHGIKDLQGKVIATEKGTSSVNYLNQHAPDIKKILQFDNIDDAYNVLAAGGADGVLIDAPVNLSYMKKHSDYHTVGGLLAGEYYGIIIAKSHSQVLAKVNQGLVAIQKNGVYRKIYQTYFGDNSQGMVKGIIPPQTVAR